MNTLSFYNYSLFCASVFLFYFIVIENTSADTEGAQSISLSGQRHSERVKHSLRRDDETYDFESGSEKGDFSADSSDNYEISTPSVSPSVSPVQKKKKIAARGINAHRLSINARRAAWDVVSLPSPARNVSISNPIRNRRRRAGSNRRLSRPNILAEHRQYVEHLEEEELERGVEKAKRLPKPKLPVLSNGKSEFFSPFFM